MDAARRALEEVEELNSPGEADAEETPELKKKAESRRRKTVKTKTNRALILD